ncbi:unnamed protein product, partial [Discosporangium mesarthrocarpum]
GGRIKVCCRVRPLNCSSPPGKAILPRRVGKDGHKVVVKSSSRPTSATVTATRGKNIGNMTEKWGFTFDDVIGESCEQQQVYNNCAAGVVKSVLEGYNGTVMAYGCTGAGKTFTMLGGRDGTYESRGVCARAVSHVFREAQRFKGERMVTVQLSFLEIYNEQVFDLLALDSSDPSHQQSRPRFSTSANLGWAGGDTNPNPGMGGRELSLYERADGSTYVKGLIMHEVATEEEALRTLHAGETNRSIAEHQLNHASSSRSHAVFTIHLTIHHNHRGKEGMGPGPEATDSPTLPWAPAQGHSGPGSRGGFNEGTGGVMTSKLNMVDLAGSERMEESETAGMHQKETVYINKSLTFLEQVTIALADKKRDHIPYRQSKLTHMLKDSLGGNCHMVMIACIWPQPKRLTQSLATLKFASRMRCIKNKPTINRQ